MAKMEKFDYGNFGKFFNEIISNPDVVKKRDFLAERALAWFDVSADDVTMIDKLEVIKDLYRFISLSYYMVFKDNEEASKLDIISVKKVKKEFPDDVYRLNKVPESWQYMLTYYSGIIDALSKVVKTKDNKNFKELLDQDDDESSE